MLPDPALFTLIGPAGSGKTTLAKAFPAEWRIELDALRGMISDPGDQTATPAAVAISRLLLDGRLQRQKSVLTDSTSTEPGVRAELLQAARTWGVPAVAITVRTDLATCLARQDDRPPNRRVPPQIVAGQHAAMPSREQLLAEGWDQVHDADDPDLPTTVATATASADARAVWDRLNPIERDGLVSILRTVLSAPDLGAEILALADRHPAR